MGSFFGGGVLLYYKKTGKRKMRTKTKSPFMGAGVPLAINDGKGKYDCCTRMLKALHNQSVTALSHHSKVLAIRYDLRPKIYTKDNRLIRDILDKINRWYKANSYGEMCYLWVREQDKKPYQHYHLVLFVNGNKLQTSHSITQKIYSILANKKLPQTALHLPENCYQMVHRGNYDEYAKMFERSSYLAKTNTKEKKSKYTRNFSQSKIQPNSEKLSSVTGIFTAENYKNFIQEKSKSEKVQTIMAKILSKSHLNAR